MRSAVSACCLLANCAALLRLLIAATPGGTNAEVAGRTAARPAGPLTHRQGSTFSTECFVSAVGNRTRAGIRTVDSSSASTGGGEPNRVYCSGVNLTERSPAGSSYFDGVSSGCRKFTNRNNWFLKFTWRDARVNWTGRYACYVSYIQNSEEKEKVESLFDLVIQATGNSSESEPTISKAFEVVLRTQRPNMVTVTATRSDPFSGNASNHSSTAPEESVGESAEGTPTWRTLVAVLGSVALAVGLLVALVILTLRWRKAKLKRDKPPASLPASVSVMSKGTASREVGTKSTTESRPGSSRSFLDNTPSLQNRAVSTSANPSLPTRNVSTAANSHTRSRASSIQKSTHAGTPGRRCSPRQPGVHHNRGRPAGHR